MALLVGLAFFHSTAFSLSWRLLFKAATLKIEKRATRNGLNPVQCLAAENSDFSVAGELLAETLVVKGTGNVDGSYRLIGLKDRWTVGLKTVKRWHAQWCCIDAVL